MGQRGPVKGQGGRPPGGKQKPKADATGSNDTHEFAQTLSQLEFDEFVEYCKACGGLQPQDSVVLTLFWQTTRTYSRLDCELSEGPLCDQKDLLVQLAKLQVQIATLAARFGMDPASRIRLGIEALPPQADAVDESPFERRQRIGRELGVN